MKELWEYHTVAFDSSYEETIVVVLNELGKDGWELVQVTDKDRRNVFYFKRKVG